MVHKPRRNHGTLPEGGVVHPSDAALEVLAANLLATSGQVDASGVKVTCADRRITLTGTVFRREEIERCAGIVMSLRGVEDVVNALKLSASAERQALPGSSRPRTE